MGDKVSNRKLNGLGFAALALGFVAVAGSLSFEAPAEAAAKASKADKSDKAAPSKGRQLFVDMSCGSCHVLKDAGGSGHVGPVLDGTKLTKAFVVGRITNGQGAMPSFNGTLTKAEIDALATYVSAQSNK